MFMNIIPFTCISVRSAQGPVMAQKIQGPSSVKTNPKEQVIWPAICKWLIWKSPLWKWNLSLRAH